jgi:hypothetical protein
MIIPYLFTILVIIGWFIFKREDFSTLRLGAKHITDIFLLFFTLSFIAPGFIENIVSQPDTFPPHIVSIVYALTYILIIGLAIIVLTYEPSEVYDVLLVKIPDGTPIASRIKLFQSDDVLISGFFTAISSVSKELDEDKTDLQSIRRGDREILIEDGVFTRIIALVDRDQVRIRQGMQSLLRKFEVKHSKELSAWIGDLSAVPEKAQLVEEIGQLSIKFDIPNQTRLIGVLTLILTPLMITLIGFLGN